MRRTTLTDEIADLLGEEAPSRRTSVSAVARDLLTEGFVGSETKPHEIPWAAIIDDPAMPAARDLKEILEREWPDAIARDR